MNKEYKNFKCNESNTFFRIMAISDDIRYAVCPKCGSNQVDYIFGYDERKFEKQIVQGGLSWR